MTFFAKHFGNFNVQQHAAFGLLVCFSAFLETLKEAALPTDLVKFKRANVEKKVNGYKNGMVLLEDEGSGTPKKWIKSAGVLKYVFAHSSQVAFCSALAEEIDSLISQQKTSSSEHDKPKKESLSFGTILDLYRFVANLTFREEDIESFFNRLFQADQTSVQTLYQIHKDFFNDQEWQKVVYFEYHFALSCGSEPKKTAEDELNARTGYLRILCKAIELKDEICSLNKKAIEVRNMRKESDVAKMQPQMTGAYVHLYKSLDRQVQMEAEKYSLPVGDIVAIPSALPNHISLCCYLTGTTTIHLSEIYSILSTHLLHKHGLGLEKLLVLARGTFKTYYRKELKGYARFTLHDDICSQKVKLADVYEKESVDDSEEQDQVCEFPAKCECCFPVSMPRALSISSFDLLREWVMDVPLPIQLLLESSISLKSFKDSSDKSKFLQPKLTKLYLAYDTMLNNLNHKYTGLLQQANTLELIMHSKCLNTVFKVASNSGIAMSLSSATRYLENNSADDLLYYNTYLKGQPLTYKCQGVQVNKDVCLRDCILILMIDNLVRLKFRDDPNPGENRSKQMNTLPITIQGIAQDSDEVASWHLETCDGSADCYCRKSTQLTSEDFVPLMVTLLPDEEVASKRFSQLCTWGYPGLWKRLIEG